MVTLTVSLTKEQWKTLQEKARRYGIAPEALLQAKIEEWLSRPDEAFTFALTYVLEKNAELYQRLAHT